MASFLHTCFAIASRWPTVLVAAYSLAVLSWSMPAGLFPYKSSLDAITTKPLIFLNLWQGWDMFSPEPRSEDIWIDVLVIDRDGSQHHWPLTHMIEMPYFDRWQKERWRKYFNDHLRLDAERTLWKPFAEYWLRTLQTQGHDPITIELTRLWHPTHIPVSAARRADLYRGPWNRFVFYRWTASERGSR